MSFKTIRACVLAIAAMLFAIALQSPAIAWVYPVITTRLGAGFVILWQDGQRAVLAQRMSRTGRPVGARIVVDDYTGSDGALAAAELTNGSFAVVWETDSGLSGRRLAADGTRLGSAFRVGLRGVAVWPAITALSGGGFVVLYAVYKGAPGYDVYGEIYAANGTHVRRVLLFNSAQSEVEPAAAALPDGGFVAVASGHVVRAQRFHADGSKNGAELLVDDTNTFDGRVAVLKNGTIVVVWTRYVINYPQATNKVYARRYWPDGTPKGAPFVVSETNQQQYRPDIAALSGGGFVVVMNERNENVVGQRFTAQAAPAGEKFRANKASEQGDDPYLGVAPLPRNGFAVAWEGNTAVYYNVLEP